MSAIRRESRLRLGGRTLHVLFSVLFIGAVASCALPLLHAPAATKQGGTLLLTINGNVARTLLPGIDMNTASYDIKGTGPNGGTFDQSTTQTSNEITGLVAGTWNVSVAALNKDGQNIGIGSSSVTLDSSTQATLSITVAPIQGNGTLTLTTTWPASEVQSPSITASLLPPAGSTIPLDYTVGSGTASVTNSSIASGYYTLSQSLLENGTLVMGAVEVVRIVAGQTTSGSFDFSNLNVADPTIGVNITPAMNNPLTVTLSGIVGSDLIEGDSMTVTAGVTNYSGNLTYVFYLNGQAQATGTTASPSWTFGSNLQPGNYRIDVTAFTADGTQAGSTSDTFTVSGTTAGTTNTNSNVFTVGVWLQDPLRTSNGQIDAVNYKNIGINTFVGLWQWPTEPYTGYDVAAAQALQDNGLKAIAGNNQAAVDWINSNSQFASTFIGYLLGDEPDMSKASSDAATAAASMPDAWQQAGDALHAADPTRAIYANFGFGFALDPWSGYVVNPGPTQADDFAKYVEPTTMLSSDYYGITVPAGTLDQHGVWTYGRAVTNTEKYAGSRPVYGFVEGSSPYSQGKVASNIAATMPPNLIAPIVWNMVVHGAQGIIYFCHDFSNGGTVVDGCLENPGMPAAMSAANQSVQSYADILLSPSVTGTSATTDGSVAVTTLTKQLNGYTYVFAMGDGNSSNIYGQAVNATITVAGAGSGTVTDLTDGRSISMTNGQFTDHFDAYQLHIYRF